MNPKTWVEKQGKPYFVLYIMVIIFQNIFQQSQHFYIFI